MINRFCAVASGMTENERSAKRGWKNLRDRHIMERKNMREKRSGAGAEQRTTWKHDMCT